VSDLQRPALVRLRADGRVAAGLRLAINPEHLVRTIEASPSGPRQTVEVLVPLDATDALAQGDRGTGEDGVLPPLGALEQLMAPAAKGVGPVLLVWGPRRMAVEVVRLEIVEESFLPTLVPIRAAVRVTLAVVADVERGVPGADLVVGWRQRQTALARRAAPASASVPELEGG
jgi:hypothetical protein